MDHSYAIRLWVAWFTEFKKETEIVFFSGIMCFSQTADRTLLRVVGNKQERKQKTHFRCFQVFLLIISVSIHRNNGTFYMMIRAYCPNRHFPSIQFHYSACTTALLFSFLFSIVCIIIVGGFVKNQSLAHHSMYVVFIVYRYLHENSQHFMVSKIDSLIVVYFSSDHHKAKSLTHSFLFLEFILSKVLVDYTLQYQINFHIFKCFNVIFEL